MLFSSIKPPWSHEASIHPPLTTLSFSAISQKEIKLGEVAAHVGDSVTVSAKIDGVKVFVDDDKKPPPFTTLPGCR